MQKREVFDLETCLEESLDVIEELAAEKGNTTHAPTDHRTRTN
jgi:hypothetical protein